MEGGIGMIDLVLTALTLPATIYGMGEKNCGDPGMAVACDTNAVTASGERFDPSYYTAAVPAPTNRKMRPVLICIRNPDTGKMVKVWVNDKANARWQGNRGLDLTPAAYEALTGRKVTKWSSIPRLEKC